MAKSIGGFAKRMPRFRRLAAARVDNKRILRTGGAAAPTYGQAMQGYSNATGNLLSGVSGNIMGFIPQPATGCEPNWVALGLSFGAGYYANRMLTEEQRQEIDSMLP